MKKIFLFLALLLVSSKGWSAVPAPRADSGDPLATIDFVGADTFVMDASYTTGAVVASSASVIVYGVTANNAAIGDYLVFRSTNLGATTIVSTTTLVYVSTSALFAAGGSAGANSTFSYKFPVPFKMTNGMSLKLNATVAAPGNWTIFYRKVRATE